MIFYITLHSYPLMGAVMYIGVRDCPYGICCPWVRGGWNLDALGKFFGRRRRRRRRLRAGGLNPFEINLRWLHMKKCLFMKNWGRDQKHRVKVRV